MNKKSFFYILISALVLLSGCTNQSNSDDYLNQYKTIPELYKSDIVLKQCLTSSLNNCMGNAVTNKATEAMDESICDDLQDVEFKNKCIGSVKVIQAVQEKDITGCSQLTGNLLYNCEIDIYNMQAFEKMDVDICKDIQPQDSSETDGFILFKYEEGRKNCINDITIAIATKNLDESMCDELDDSLTQTFCKDNVVFERDRLAQNSQNTNSGSTQEILEEEQEDTIN